MLQVPDMHPDVLSAVLDEPFKEFPKNVLQALPQTPDLSCYPVPSIFRDHHRHLCVLAGVGHKYAAVIPFDTAGLRLVRLPLNQFGYAFDYMADTPVEKALPMFTRNASKVGATQEALRLLNTFNKELLMKNLHAVIIAAAVATVHPSKKAAEEEAKSKEGAVVVSNAEDLTQFTVVELTSVFNSVATKQVKKLSDKSADTATRVWEAIKTKFSGGDKTEASPDAKDEPKKKKVNGAAASGEKRMGPKPESKMGKMLAALQKKGGADVEALVKASGFDDKNVRTAIGILRSGRVAGGVKYEVILDKEKGTYSVAA